MLNVLISPIKIVPIQMIRITSRTEIGNLELVFDFELRPIG